MAVSLLEISQRVMDLYYQIDSTSDDFFDLADFRFHFASYYSDLLDKLFQQERKEKRQMDGFANVEIPMSWAISETLQVKEDEVTGDLYVKTSQPMFTFKYDNFGYGIVRIIQGKPEDKECHTDNARNEFAKVTVDEANYLRQMPVTTKCYFFPADKNRLVFPGKNPIAVIPWYVPQLLGQNDSELVADALVKDCIEGALTLMFKSKGSVPIIDYTNNQNRNINQNDLKQQTQ